jgi:hypothetical protein
MANIRNIVMHACLNVDLTTLWPTVQEDFPKLKQQMDHLLTEQQPHSKATKKRRLPNCAQKPNRASSRGGTR